jgi:hypothetical protein
MTAPSDWIPPLVAGVTFAGLGLCKLYGWWKGIVGGGGRPWQCRLGGRCPSWSREFNLGFAALLLVVGLVNLGLVFALMWKR